MHQVPQIQQSTLLFRQNIFPRSFPSLVSNTFKAQSSAGPSAGPVSKETFAGNLVPILISIISIFYLSFSSISFVLPQNHALFTCCGLLWTHYPSYNFSYLSTDFRYKNSSKTTLYTSEYQSVSLTSLVRLGGCKSPVLVRRSPLRTHQEQGPSARDQV